MKLIFGLPTQENTSQSMSGPLKDRIDAGSGYLFKRCHDNAFKISVIRNANAFVMLYHFFIQPGSPLNPIFRGTTLKTLAKSILCIQSLCRVS